VGGPTRRDFVKGVTAGVTLAACGAKPAIDVPDGGEAPPDGAPIAPPETVPEVARFELGISAGDLVDDRAVLWTRYDGAAPLVALVWRMAGDAYIEELGPYPAVPAAGGFVHVPIAGLRAGERYRYAFVETAGDARVGRSIIGRFRAPIAPDASEVLTFGAVSCTDESRPLDVLARAAERDDLDAFLFLGDNAYCESCNTLDDYHAFYTRHFRRPEHVAIRARTGNYMTWDDHEVDNDWNPETIEPARLDAAFQSFFEHAAIAPVPGAERRIWRSARWGTTAEVFVLDCRSERRPSTILSGSPEYLSPEQLAWLKAGLRDSPAVFKIIMNSVPITDMPLLWDAYPTDRWEGYAAQRRELLQFIDDSAIRGVIWISGDFHLAFIANVATSGPGANQRELLCGPGAQEANPLTWTLQPPQFSFATDTNNYTLLRLDPASRAVTVSYIDAAGTAFYSESYVP
jgi:alkaline phosphatase D